MSELRALGRQWMSRCVELARKGAGRVSPNPMVGAVVLDSRGRLVGEGYHKKVGGPHAEVFALRAAGPKARGGTLICNLEPCNHDGRTPPCATAIAGAGIARVVFGAPDPIASHSGGGRALRRAGIEVLGSVERIACERENRIFFTFVRDGRPHVVVKGATSLDGKISTEAGESQWITSEKARSDGRRLRGQLDAICVGIGTVKSDDPKLTARRRGARDPLRVIFDSDLSVPVTARVLPDNSDSEAECLIVCGQQASRRRQSRLENLGAEVVRQERAQPEVGELCSTLARRHITSLLVEGGPTLIASFLAADLADELRLYQAPIVIGGAAPSWLAGESAPTLAAAPRFDIARLEEVGGDLAITYLRRRAKSD